VVTAGGFALAALSPMPVGKQVFLLVIGPITTVMHGMTPAAATVKKAAFGRSKSPADAGKKIADCGSPSPALPKGQESILAVFYAVGWNSLPLGRVVERPLCLGNSVGVAFSRRRYPRQDDGLLFLDGYYQIEYNAFG